MSHRTAALAFCVALAALVSLPARGADGALEINHACATNGGCFPGDLDEYPVTITQAGSYRLTGNLVVPAGTNGIELANGVDVDLGGFEIAGPVSCLAGCPASSAGSGIVSAPVGGNQCAVSNGKVRGFGEDGIRLGLQADVRRVRVTDVARDGLSLSGGSLAAENLVNRVGRNGIRFSVSGAIAPSLYRDNTIANAAGQSVVSGKASGPNVCQDQRCATSGKKRFYLTTSSHTGAVADIACAAGYHMASFFEIYDVTALEYDDALGATTADSGQGPPSPALEAGWIRSGIDSSLANCLAWTSASGAVDGTQAALTSNWQTTLPRAPWSTSFNDCSLPQRVWCAED